ncbi:MAG: DinB family protein [Planctomycetota bacterium]
MNFDLKEAMSILECTPAVLSSWLGSVGEAWIHGSEGEGTWSPFDVVGHLIHGERTDWMARLQIILAQGESRRFETFDRHAHFAASVGQTLGDLLVTFSELRRSNVRTLKALDIQAEQLDLTGVHPVFGEVTLRQLLATWVAHDLGHIAQIARVMAKQYRTEVGPWAAYLPVLSIEPGRGGQGSAQE